MLMASLHVRVAYSDNRRWAAVYLLDEMPGNIRALLDESHRLAKQTLMQNATAPIAPATAMAMVAGKKNSAARPEIAALEAAVKAKVKVMHSGQVSSTDKPPIWPAFARRSHSSSKTAE
ncbi:MAG TPA: hypothetical protein VG826_22180 [Pirellulales bacterium]|nr:hypothetical protein [Pirellulales bacterium]